MKDIHKHAQNIIDNEELNQLITSTEVALNFCEGLKEEGFDIKSLPTRFVSEKSIEGLSNFYNVELTKVVSSFKHLSFERKGIVLTFMTR